MDKKDGKAQGPPATEGLNPASLGLDALGAAEIAARMHAEDQKAVAAVGAALGDITKAIEEAVASIRGGGRLVYAGAGTSGRLGVLDASEIPPTFSSRAIVAVMAGGLKAVTEAAEGAEDDVEAGAHAARDTIKPGDMALGISASGQTPYVVAFLLEAARIGAHPWLMTCNPAARCPASGGTIILDTGQEIIAGSTRLKAGTATKLALNMISTAAMAIMGGTHDGLMVDVAPTNAKLIKRAAVIVMAISGATLEEAHEALCLSGMSPKAAALMCTAGMGAEEAHEALRRAGGSLRRALLQSGR